MDVTKCKPWIEHLRNESDLFQASNKWMQHWKSQASDDSTWARIQRQPVNSRHGIQSSQVPELFVTVSICFNLFQYFQDLSTIPQPK